MVVADPPYSQSDAERYGVALVDRAKVMRTLQRLPQRAHVVWLDQVSPMYSKAVFLKEAVIGVIGSVNHRYRLASVFRRRDANRESISGPPLTID
jgi:hypothetical protein